MPILVFWDGWPGRAVTVYAIIEDGGRQYRVQPGDTVDIDLKDLAEDQQTIEFDRVLMVGDGDDVRIGQPVIEGAKVVAKVVSELKGPKLYVIKFKRRKGYQRKQGHRQQYLRVQIDKIVTP